MSDRSSRQKPCGAACFCVVMRVAVSVVSCHPSLCVCMNFMASRYVLGVRAVSCANAMEGRLLSVQQALFPCMHVCSCLVYVFVYAFVFAFLAPGEVERWRRSESVH